MKRSQHTQQRQLKPSKNLPELMSGLLSNDPTLQLECITGFRKLLSKEFNPPIGQVIAAGAVPHFVQFLSLHDYPALQFEAAWALTNIASGSSRHTKIVIEAGAVRPFVQLLASPNEDVREQALWAVGNIAGDSPQCRDFVLQQGAMGPLLQNLTESSHKLSVMRNATWALSNLCRGKPAPAYEFVRPAFPVLAHCIYYADEEVLTDACWALAHLSEDDSNIQKVIESGVCRRLVELLQHHAYSVKTAALRAVGNILSGDDLQTQIMINCSVLPCLLSLLSCSRKSIRKEACWAISNITAGPVSQLQAVIDCNIIPALINLVNNNSDFEKKDALWALSNATRGGSPEQIRYLVEQGCIKSLCGLLTASDASLVKVALEALEHILKAGKRDSHALNAATGRNLYAAEVEAVDGLDKIEQLQSHHDRGIYEKAVNILENYFSHEEEEDDCDGDGGANGAPFTFAALSAALPKKETKEESPHIPPSQQSI